jgi:hypothetical protein
MNMAAFFLGSHPLDGVHVVELDQGAVFSNFSDARSAISRTCGPEVAALFAEPILSRGNGEAPARIDWYTALDGKISAIDDVDPGTAAIVREKLASRLKALRELEIDPEVGFAISAALNVFSASSILRVGDEPVIMNWGMLPAGLTGPDARKQHFERIFGSYLKGAPPPPLSRAEWVADFVPPPNRNSVGRTPEYAADQAALVAAAEPAVVFTSRRAATFACCGAGVVLLLLLIPNVLRYTAVASSETATDASGEAIILNYQRRQRLLQVALSDPCRVPGPVDGNLLLPPSPTQIVVGPDLPGAASTPIQRSDAERSLSSAPQSISPSAPVTGPMDLASRIEAGVVLVVADDSVGSGFFISSELIVTNQHVTAGASDVLVASKKVGMLRAKVIGRGVEDETRDFSLLRVAPQGDAIPFEFAVPAAPLSPVIAAGFPGLYLATDPVFQQLKNGDRDAVKDLSPIFQSGVVSHLQRHPEAETTLVLHSAEISPGNSGGPLVDYCGRVIGVNTFLRSDRRLAVTARYALGVDGLKKFLHPFGVHPSLAGDPCMPRVAQQAASVPSSQTP